MVTTSEIRDADVFFCNGVTTPVPAAAPFLPESGVIGWADYRDSGIPARFVSDMSGSDDYRQEFLVGARMLGLDSPRKPLHPQQLVIADVMNAADANGIPLHQTVAVCIPRRATKTTSIFAVALGRLMQREDYQVAFTAQSGTKARDRFIKDLVTPLERRFPDKDSRPFRINRSRGGEHITFDNGSSIVVLPPQGDSFRGDAYDLVIADESQVHGPEDTEELLGAIMPTFDTRPGAQLVVAGTTGEHRSGLLWKSLEEGRNAVVGSGIVEYSAGDMLTEAEYEDEDVWRRAHPGIDTLTTIEVIRNRWAKLPLEQFLREYLGVWPAGGGGRFLDLGKWSLAAVEGDLPSPPEHFAFAFAIHPDGSSASIVAAWRDDDEKGHLLLIDQRRGTQWFSPAMLTLARKYRTVPVGYDTYGGPTNVQTEILGRSRPRPKLAPQTMADIKTAAALLVKELDDGRLVHYAQEEMTTAAQLAVKRKIGNGWGLGRGQAEDDITPLEAGAIALRVYDTLKKREPFRPLMAD